MTLARLFLATLLLCSLPAFGQVPTISGAPSPANAVSSDATRGDSAKTLLEPWKVIQNRPDLTSESTNPIRVDQYRFDPSTFDFRTGHSKLQTKTRTLVMGLDGTLDSDTTCYTMRSYVVARDSKDSDSTHMTGYSTCQPASRYRVKTTEERSVSLQR
jgi:hypothetical protein